MMDNRRYNVFFNLHTVSGIIISVGLYIIFFAGAFTLFVEPIRHWEEGKAHPSGQTVAATSIDYDRLLTALRANGYPLYGRSISLSPEVGEKQAFYLSASADNSVSKEAQKDLDLSFNKTTYRIYQPTGALAERYSFGRLLYDLHFYYQLGDWGYYTAGLVALFFLFALVTGVVIHWDKIVTNFFVFRPGAKLKTIWTDAHTALGTIGLPFQFLYALTGAMFGLGVLIGLSGSVFYGGDQDRFYQTTYGQRETKLGPRTDGSAYRLNPLVDRAVRRWAGFKPTYLAINNLESTTAQVRVYGTLVGKARFLSDGEVVYQAATGKVTFEADPYQTTYEEGVSALYRLHFANFGDLGTLGNYVLRFLFFLLATATAFVIITGVLIWLEARNKKHVPEKERRFNERVGHIYLAICLSMLPITAFTFIVSKLLPASANPHTEAIFNAVFFGGWLLLSVFFWRLRSNYLTNKYTLLSGGVLGLLVPMVNGLVSGNWIWQTLVHRHYEIFLIDALWLFLAVVSLYTVSRLKKPQPPADKPVIKQQRAAPTFRRVMPTSR